MRPNITKRSLHNLLTAGLLKIDGDCWIWQGAVSGKYGSVRIGGHAVTAHSAFYVRYFGAIEEGEEAHHLCINKLCVNPFHLEKLTNGDHRRHHKCILDGEQTEHIKKLRHEGKSISHIARHFKVNRMTIARALGWRRHAPRRFQ